MPEQPRCNRSYPKAPVASRKVLFSKDTDFRKVNVLDLVTVGQALVFLVRPTLSIAI